MGVGSYNLDDIDELVAFDSDCLKAIQNCPQAVDHAGCINPGNSVSVAGVFKSWFNRSLLWSSGYSKCLSDRARATFKRYCLFRDGRVLDSVRNVTFEPSDTFRLELTFKKR